MRPTIVVVSGFASNVGKTTLMCDLLKRFAGWEAIKISRGHYRSCGKDPAACCISPLLGERPTVFSGVAETCAPGKDTGRFWDAGASNVHWLICTNEQLEGGTDEALSRVQSAGVFIEGTSILKFLPTDFSLMVVDLQRNEIKSSALKVANQIDAFFVNNSVSDEKNSAMIRNKFAERNVKLGNVPIYRAQDFEGLVERIMTIHTTTKPAAPLTPLRMNM